MRAICIVIIFLSFLHQAAAQSTIDSYDLVWDKQSNNASESMPCGGGDIGMNVWVENNDIFIYVASSGNFDEHNTLMKTGRLRLRLFPNPFTGGKFRQQLHLAEGYVTVSGNGVVVKIWADVFRPVVHFEISSNKKIKVEASFESWRYQDRVVKPRENFGNSWKWAAPKNNVYTKDQVYADDASIVFYHHNPVNTIFDATVAQQGMQAVKDSLYNPIRQLAFGGMLFGKGFAYAGNDTGSYAGTDYRSWKLHTLRAARKHELLMVLHNAQVADIRDWKSAVSKTKADVIAVKDAAQQNQLWWKQFWARSFIHLNTGKQNDSAWMVGRNYQLFRYMLAANARGEWPTKFNGGLFTVDPVFTNRDQLLTPDYRNWGGGLHTAQNQRLVYFPMIRSGDWDMLQSQLQFYLRLQKNAELRSAVYWNHAGASFTEQMENYGLPDYAEYGQKRPEYFDKGVEYNAWLEYEWDTVFEFCMMMLQEHEFTGRDIRERLSFITSCLRFFDEHYQYLAKRRSNKVFDQNGHLVLFPGSAGETYKMATNATSTVAALRVITDRMLNLPGAYLDSAARVYLKQLNTRIPPISYSSYNGHVTIAPAKSWERVNNVESMQLYPVYPWGIFGLGKPGLDTALNTWRLDTFVKKFRSHVGWKQDNIWAARLGLRAEAWRLTELKLRNSERRFPAFWGPGFDWVPDHNWGGSGMIGLQEMLLQDDGQRILLFPAWPADIDVHFRLHAPRNTIVEAKLEKGKITSLLVTPESRRKDVEVMLQ